MDPGRVVGLELHLDRGQRGGRAGDGDPALASTPGGRPQCLDQPAHVGGERFQLERGGRVGGDVALGVADDAGLQRGVEGDLGAGADDQLGRAAADVDHQGRLVWGLLGGGARGR